MYRIGERRSGVMSVLWPIQDDIFTVVGAPYASNASNASLVSAFGCFGDNLRDQHKLQHSATCSSAFCRKFRISASIFTKKSNYLLLRTEIKKYVFVCYFQVLFLRQNDQWGKIDGKKLSVGKISAFYFRFFFNSNFVDVASDTPPLSRWKSFRDCHCPGIIERKRTRGCRLTEYITIDT